MTVAPFVLAGKTAASALAWHPPFVLTYLAALGAYAVGVAVVTVSETLDAEAVYPLGLTLGRGRHRAADEIELKDHTAVHKGAVLFEGYLFEVIVYGHPVCTGCYGFLVGGAEIFTDKFAESDLVANLVFVFLISNDNIISGEQFAADMAVYIVAVVVLTYLFAQGTYTVYPFVVALGRNNSLSTAHGTGVVVFGIEVVLADLTAHETFALFPFVRTSDETLCADAVLPDVLAVFVRLGIFHLVAYGTLAVFEVVLALVSAFHADSAISPGVGTVYATGRADAAYPCVVTVGVTGAAGSAYPVVSTYLLTLGAYAVCPFVSAGLIRLFHVVCRGIVGGVLIVILDGAVVVFDVCVTGAAGDKLTGREDREGKR